MTLENINDKTRQSVRFSEYMLQNPSNHTNTIHNCYAQAGLVCKSLPVKTSAVAVDHETILLRGTQSTAAEPFTGRAPANLTTTVPTATAEPFTRPFLGEMSRRSKACNGELEVSDRVRIHQPVSIAAYPVMSPDILLGENSRNTAKYGKKK